MYTLPQHDHTSGKHSRWGHLVPPSISLSNTPPAVDSPRDDDNELDPRIIKAIGKIIDDKIKILIRAQARATYPTHIGDGNSTGTCTIDGNAADVTASMSDISGGEIVVYPFGKTVSPMKVVDKSTTVTVTDKSGVSVDINSKVCTKDGICTIVALPDGNDFLFVTTPLTIKCKFDLS